MLPSNSAIRLSSQRRNVFPKASAQLCELLQPSLKSYFHRLGATAVQIWHKAKKHRGMIGQFTVSSRKSHFFPVGQVALANMATEQT